MPACSHECHANLVSSRMSTDKSARNVGKRKRVLIVDDHPLMRESVAAWIARAPDLEVCGLAASAAAALHDVQTTQPHIVVTDLDMPDRSGMELLKDLLKLQPHLPVLVLSMHRASLFAERAIAAGAAGYVMKGEGAVKLLAVIRELLLRYENPPSTPSSGDTSAS